MPGLSAAKLRAEFAVKKVVVATLQRVCWHPTPMLGLGFGENKLVSGDGIFRLIMSRGVDATKWTILRGK